MVHIKGKYLWIIVFVLICSISIVCASYNQTMMINGDAILRVDEFIRITDLKMLNMENEGYETYNSQYSKNSTNMYVSLPKINSTVTYEVTVTNKSGYLFVISDIAASLVNEAITYEITNYKIGEGIGQTSEIKFNITLKYKEGIKEVPNDYSQIASILFKFERPTASMLSYDNSKSGTTCTDVQCALDELYELLG
ncbi:MAG: hypothetical protein OSJ70_08915 [Bacilli bacterium]|nr:hypothetical protein [Bacilli bacterium]